MEPNIADREYRKPEVVFSDARHPSKEQVAPKIHKEWSLVYLGTVGALAGFLGSVTSFVANVLGAWALDVERLMLLRVYATIFEGPDALLLEDTPSPRVRDPSVQLSELSRVCSYFCLPPTVRHPTQPEACALPASQPRPCQRELLSWCRGHSIHVR